MATPRVSVAVPAGPNWTNVIGGAANIAGVTWQCRGAVPIEIAFTTAKPSTPWSGTDAVHILEPGAAYYDVNGSAQLWARSLGTGSGWIAATSD